MYQLSDNNFIKEIRLIDMLGRVIKTELFDSSNLSETIQLKEITKGSYFVEVITNSNKKDIKKIIIN